MLEAVVVLVVIALVGNFLLTWGMVRRLRALQQQVDTMFGPVENGLGPGDQAPDFTAQTRSGERVTREELVRGETVMAFFSPSCSACETHLPAVREFVGRSGAPAVVAVVDGDVDESDHLIQGLGGAVPVVFAPRRENDLMDAYQVNMFPSYYVIAPDGHVAGAHHTLDECFAPSTT